MVTLNNNARVARQLGEAMLASERFFDGYMDPNKHQSVQKSALRYARRNGGFTGTSLNPHGMWLVAGYLHNTVAMWDVPAN